ncbi:hypothetical protein D8B45_07445 [Candidatus Gracilibacteria bacterium]|nr:MAG: hypothetical protein D8B45_07445 [Candidatus Gracilibacteria bacterium]
MIPQTASIQKEVPLTDEEMTLLLDHISQSNSHFLALAQTRNVCAGSDRLKLKSVLFGMIKDYYQLAVEESNGKISKFKQYLAQIQAIEKQEKTEADKLLEEQLLAQ